MFRNHLSIFHIFKNDVMFPWLFQHNMELKLHGLGFADISLLIFFMNTFHNEFWSKMWSWFSSEFLSFYFWLKWGKESNDFWLFFVQCLWFHTVLICLRIRFHFVKKGLRPQWSNIALWAALSLSNEGHNIFIFFERLKTIAFVDGFINVFGMKLVFKTYKCYFTPYLKLQRFLHYLSITAEQTTTKFSWFWNTKLCTGSQLYVSVILVGLSQAVLLVSPGVTLVTTVILCLTWFGWPTWPYWPLVLAVACGAPVLHHMASHPPVG